MHRRIAFAFKSFNFIINCIVAFNNFNLTMHCIVAVILDSLHLAYVIVLVNHIFCLIAYRMVSFDDLIPHCLAFPGYKSCIDSLFPFHPLPFFSFINGEVPSQPRDGSVLFNIPKNNQAGMFTRCNYGLRVVDSHRALGTKIPEIRRDPRARRYRTCDLMGTKLQTDQVVYLLDIYRNFLPMLCSTPFPCNGQ